MKQSIHDSFKDQNEEREAEAGDEGEPMRGAGSDTADDESAAGRERPTERVKKWCQAGRKAVGLPREEG